MRYLLIGAALAAAPAAAQQPATAWGVFNSPDGSAGAGVQAADGSQLLLKCDKPGKRQVYAVIVTKAKLAVPGGRATYESRPITFYFDSGIPLEENWRYNGQLASNPTQSTDGSLGRVLGRLADSKKLDVLLSPVSGNAVRVGFDVTGAREAIAEAYAACKDDSPLG